MSNCVAFQTQLASIMEVLAKAAVAEISRLVEDGSVVLRLEASRSRAETAALKHKLQQLERELRTARAAARDTAFNNRSVGIQVGDPSAAAGECGQRVTTVQRCSEGDGSPEAQDTHPAFGLVLKAEQEEEHVARRLSQTGCEHSAGRLNNLDPEYVTYERDGQLWTSFTPGDSDIETDDPVCDNATEQYSQSLSVHTELQHAPAAEEASDQALSSSGKPVHMVDTAFMKEEDEGQTVCDEETKPVADTQQAEHKGFSAVRENGASQHWLELQPPDDRPVRASESVAGPNPDADNRRRKMRVHWRAGPREKLYRCTHCQKSFDRFIDLERHQRIHTGEKPFSCAQCGKRFSLRCNLITHERVHNGNKPFGCTQCGKRFSQGSNLRAHQRIHTGERPYHCTQCGKSFTQLSSLKTHQKVHSRNEPLHYGICT